MTIIARINVGPLSPRSLGQEETLRLVEVEGLREQVGN